MKNKKVFFYLFNWSSFYIYWIVCIWGAARNEYLIGPALGFITIICHIFLVKEKFKEVKYILICLISGFIIQSIFYYLNILHYNGELLIGKIIIIPLWLLILWAGFGTTIFHSLKWILNRALLGGILGSVLSLFMYFFAYKWDVILFKQNLWNYLIIALFSAINFYILIHIATKMSENE